MPAPSEEDVEALRQRLCSAIDVGIMEPLAAVDAVELLTDLCRYAPARAEELLARVRQHATNARWSRQDVQRISFRAFEREARVRERADEATRRTVVQAAERFTAGGRGRPRRTETNLAAVAGAMTPEQRIDSDSPYLVMLGHLELRRRGRIWYDSFRHKAMTNWSGDHDDAILPPTVITDSFERKVYAWLLEIDPRLVKTGEKVSESAIKYIAESDVRNEVTDWVDTLRWDGEDRLIHLMHRAYGTPDDEYHQAVGRNWILSMMARMKTPGAKVDTMPVFTGAQGIFKSQSLAVIGGPWYAAAVSSIDSEKFLQELQGAIVIEIPEMHSIVSSKAGASKIKAVLSTEMDRFRPAWARNVSEFKRTSVLAGTTNDRGWHLDDTGGRRFWPIHCTTIDLDWLRDNRTQLFAEAKAAIENGATWWEVPADEQERRIEAERASDPWEDIIQDRLGREAIYRGAPDETPTRWDGTFGEAAEWGNLVTTARVSVAWLRMTPEIMGRHSRRIASIMRRLGWESTRLRVGSGTPPRVWLPAGDATEVAAERSTMTEQELAPSAPVDDDIPF